MPVDFGTRCFIQLCYKFGYDIIVIFCNARALLTAEPELAYSLA